MANTKYFNKAGVSRSMPSLILQSETSPTYRKNKKMNAFKRIIKAWLFPQEDYESVDCAPRTPELYTEKFINLKIHPANGGFVIEVSPREEERYHPTQLTIVDDYSKLGEAIQKIVTIQGLKG